MFDLPPAFHWLWLQVGLWGIIAAMVRRDVSMLCSVSVSLGLALTVTWMNATLCGAILNDVGIGRGLLKGFGGFGFILPAVFPVLLIAPASCLIVKSGTLFLFRKAQGNIHPAQFSTIDLIFLMSIFAVGAWQLSCFVKHRAF